MKVKLLSWIFTSLSLFIFSILICGSLSYAQAPKVEKKAQIKVSKKEAKQETKKTSQITVAKEAKTDIQNGKQANKKTSELSSTKPTAQSGENPKILKKAKEKSKEKTAQKTKNQPKPNAKTKQMTKRIRARRLGRLNERDSAFAPRKGSWSIGLFNPLKIQVNDDIGIETHPLVALVVAPHIKVWQNMWSKSAMRLQGMYGFTTPSWSLQRNIPFGLASYLSPSCQVNEAEGDRAPSSCQRPGFDFVPQLGARLSGEQRDGIWTVEADLAVGFMVTDGRPAPLDTYAPVEMAYAPSTNLYRGHLGFKYSQNLHPRFAMNVAADLYVTGQADAKVMPEKEPLSFSSQLSFDWATSTHTSLTFGAIMWVSDQRAFALIEDQQGFVQKEAVMSLDLFPTIDFMWHY
jgi:hypothetical protein